MKIKLKTLLLFIVVILSTITCSTSCKRSIYAMEREEQREAVFNEGYEEGFEAGRIEGFKDAQFWLEEDLSDISNDIEDEWGFSPERAIRVLEHYADGEPISENELNLAIWAIRKYYWDSCSAIQEIEDNFYR